MFLRCSTRKKDGKAVSALTRIVLERKLAATGSSKAFRDLKVQRVNHSETLQVSVAFAVVEQAFEEF
jgi:hypothetical protein